MERDSTLGIFQLRRHFLIITYACPSSHADTRHGESFNFLLDIILRHQIHRCGTAFFNLPPFSLCYDTHNVSNAFGKGLPENVKSRLLRLDYGKNKRAAFSVEQLVIGGDNGAASVKHGNMNSDARRSAALRHSPGAGVPIW